MPIRWTRSVVAIVLGLVVSIAGYSRLRPVYLPVLRSTTLTRLLLALFLPAAAAAFCYVLQQPSARASVGAADAETDTTEAVVFRIMVFMMSLHVLIIGDLAGVELLRASAARVLIALAGFTLAAIGRVLHGVRPGALLGIRTRWTLADRRVWTDVHRRAGYAAVGIGIALVLLAAWPGSAVPAATCDWRADGAAAAPSAEHRLTDDALLAEDLAIRFADTLKGHRAAHSTPLDEYAPARDHCMAVLFGSVADAHGVSMEEVRESLRKRRRTVDVAIWLSWAGLFCLMVDRSIRLAHRAVDEGEFLARSIAVLVILSVLVPGIGVVLGELWLGMWEAVRLGNAHLSYRGNRIPWSHSDLFRAGVAIFWVFVTVRYGLTRRQPTGLISASRG